MRRKLTAWGGGAALVMAAITIPATTAAAAEYSIDFDFPDAWAQAESTLEWSINDAADDICDDPEIFINGLPDVGTITVDPDGRGGIVDLAAAADNGRFIVDYDIECGSDNYWGSLSFAEINIEKQVRGTPYTSENFEVEVAFDSGLELSFTDTAVFSSFGGTATFYQFEEGEWDFEETVDGGADSVSISPESLVPDPGRHTVTIINQFPITVPASVSPSVDFITTNGERDWESSDDYPPMCDNGDVSTSGYLVSQDEEVNVEPAFDVSVNDDGNTGTVDVANAPGSGFYTTEVSCENDGLTFIYSLNTAVDVYTLTKEVQGDVPADANFEIEVTASHPVDSDDGELEHGPNAQTLAIEFPTSGGEQKVFHHTGELWAFWTAEETDDGGAESVNIEERNYLDENGDAFATVTNVFASAVPEEEGPEEDGPEEEAPKPAPVEKQPSYAG